MTTIATRALIAALIAGLAAPATAQVFGAEDRAADAVEDIEDAVSDDFERERPRFGNDGRPLGWTGSVSARATATDGNTDNSDLGIGARVGYFDGVNGHALTLSYTYGEDDGDTTDNSLLAGYDYTREFGTNTFFYGQAQLAYDEFDSYETDAFVGVGLGYRIFNTRDRQWSIQAGPGYRYLETSDGMEVEEGAVSLSSNYFARLSPTVSVTADTDVLWSETDTLVTNELGLNVAMSRQLALRTSVLTEYRTDPLPGFEDTDNTFGVSVVYNFN